MLNCLIVDDELHAIDVLKHHVSQTPFLQLVGSTTSPMEALQTIQENKIDLVFLDIQMPDINGIDFIKVMDGKCKVILTTAYSEFATRGFELDVIDYLLKPISLSRFLQAAQRAANRAMVPLSGVSAAGETADDYMFIKTEFKGKMLKINFQDIEYIEGMKNYVAIHHGGKKTMALLNMKDLEERLSKKHFIRVHKSFIVAVNRIVAVEGNRIVMANSHADIVLGDTYKTDFMEIMRRKLME